MAVSAAVFLDKDGTLLEDVPYNVDPARVSLAKGAKEALAAFADRRLRVIVVSNQPGLALGLFSREDLEALERHLVDTLELHGFYYCPHHPHAGCDCRKPSPGLLLLAAREQGVDLARSWMVGDILDDVEAGRRAGCRTCLIDNGNETEWELTELRTPDAVAADLAQAAARILGE